MQVIIPMSGFGERFRRAGYTVPKPLIEVDGKTIIDHVVSMFPGETDFTFICNRDHLENQAFRMREILERCCTSGRIVPIEPHKLGPVNAVLQVADLIKPDEPAIVNYCDFTCYWNYARFKGFVEHSECDGAIVCYTGFHPHMLHSVNFAYVMETAGRVTNIQEKCPFTDTPMAEYASSGTYYFKSGRLLLEYFEKSMRPDLALNGEYYVSMVYKPMIEEGLDISVFPIQHFMQWGTPEDLAEYRYFSQMFRNLVQPRPSPRQDGAVMIPMAGLGSRFSKEGYADPKPLIPVSGKPMAVQSMRDLPQADRAVFIVRRDMDKLDEIMEVVKGEVSGVVFVVLDKLTEGQACTCLAGMNEIDPSMPLTIGACDNGALYDADAFEAMMNDKEIDVLVWVARGYPGAVTAPHMYGWVDAEGGAVRRVSVKTPLSNPSRDPIITGTFTFKRVSDFVASVDRMMAREGRINGEFYVDTCINDAVELGLRVGIIEVDSYLCWGTPEDLRRFEYWQSCFHKWDGHPYRLENDPDIAPEALAEIEARYAPDEAG